MNKLKAASIILSNKRYVKQILSNLYRGGTVPFDYARKDGYSRNPKALSILVTKRCNLKCSMCHYYKSTLDNIKLHNEDMDVKLVENLVNQWHGPKPYICLTGGEPLLHPKIVDFVKTIKEKGFICSIATNGVLLKSKADALVDAGLDLISISIDGDSIIHDKIRGVNGTFEKATDSVKYLVALKKQKKTKFPAIAINVTMSNDNIEILDKMVDLAKNLGVDALNFQHLWIETETMEKSHNASSEFAVKDVLNLQNMYDSINREKLFKKIKEIKKNNKSLMITFFPELNKKMINIYYTNPEKFLDNNSCKCAWMFSDINPDGSVMQCKEIRMGNLNSATFDEIWNGETYRKFRKNLKKLKRFPLCARCCYYFRQF